MKIRRKALLLLLPLLSTGLLLLGFVWPQNTTSEQKTKQEKESVRDDINRPETTELRAAVAPEEKEISIVGVGDIMIGTNYPSVSYLPPNDGKTMLSAVHDVLQSADVTFGNHEGVILDNGGTVKRCSDPSVCYAFRTPEKYAKNLQTAGFDVMSIANNHVGDFGPSGRSNTIKVLESLGIEVAGLQSKPSVSFEKNGVKYGFAAFAPNSGTVDIRKTEEAKALVGKLAEENDIVIVSFHGGAEGRSHQHTPCKTEYFYGENRGNVCEFAHAVIDAGADIVFGHGPHVTRAFELYKDRFIAYSLGNFCTYGRFSLRGESGVAPIVSLKVNEKGEFLSGQVTPIIQHGRGGVALDETKRAVKLLQSLTKADFPQTPLLIADDGKLSKK